MTDGVRMDWVFCPQCCCCFYCWLCCSQLFITYGRPQLRVIDVSISPLFVSFPLSDIMIVCAHCDWLLLEAKIYVFDKNTLTDASCILFTPPTLLLLAYFFALHVYVYGTICVPVNSLFLRQSRENIPNCCCRLSAPFTRHVLRKIVIGNIWSDCVCCFARSFRRFSITILNGFGTLKNVVVFAASDVHVTPFWLIWIDRHFSGFFIERIKSLWESNDC